MADVLGQAERVIASRLTQVEVSAALSDHADNMLRERSIPHWQIVDGIEDGGLLSERPHTRPNPTVEVEQLLADGSPIKAVWAHVVIWTGQSL